MRFFRGIGVIKSWFADKVFQRLFRNAGWLMGGNAVAGLIGLIAMAITARTLGPAGFGVLVLMTTYIRLVDRLLNFQSWQAVIKFGAHALENKDTPELARLIKFGTFLDITSAVAGTVVAIAGTSFIAGFLGLDDQQTGWLTLYSLVIVFHLGGVPTGVLRLLDRFYILSAHQVIVALISLAGVITVWLIDGGLGGFLLAAAICQIAGNIALLAAGWWALHRHGLGLAAIWRTPLRGAKNRLATVWHFVFYTNIESAVKILREMDVFIIKAMISAEAVGLYRIARKLSEVADQFIGPFFYASFPSFNKLAAGTDWQGLRRLVWRSSVIVGGIVTLGWIVFILLGDWFIQLAFGAVYADAYPVAVVCLLGMVFWGFAQPFAPALYSTTAYRQVFIIHLVTSALYLLLIPLFIHPSGLIGAAWAYTIFYFAWSTAMFVQLKRQIKTH